MKKLKLLLVGLLTILSVSFMSCEKETMDEYVMTCEYPSPPLKYRLDKLIEVNINEDGYTSSISYLYEVTKNNGVKFIVSVIYESEDCKDWEKFVIYY